MSEKRNYNRKPTTYYVEEITEELMGFIGEDVEQGGVELSGRQIIETLNGKARKWGLSNPRQVPFILNKAKRQGLLNFEVIQTRRGKRYRILPT